MKQLSDLFLAKRLLLMHRFPAQLNIFILLLAIGKPTDHNIGFLAHNSF